jgi:tripartite-type tricarboxylate transporter receptor subunit TctC
MRAIFSEAFTMRHNGNKRWTFTRMALGSLAVGCCLLGSALFVQAAQPRAFDEKAAGEFYRGKTVTIVVGFAPGGGYDISARLVAKHMGRHIPGSPTVIVDNRPGAGSLVAANLVYKGLRPDGTNIVTFNSQMVLQQLLGQQGIEFDGRQFNWLGSVSSSQSACGVHLETGITHIKQLMGPGGRVVNMGGESPGSGITDTAAVIRAALGAKFKIIYGYAGSRPVANAVLNRELDGMCISWESFTSDLKMFFEPKKLLNVVVIFGTEVPKHPWLENAEAAEAIAPNSNAQTLLKLVHAPGKISFPYAAAPGVPADRLAALRTAFDKTLADPVFVAEYQKYRQLVPRNGEEVGEIVRDLLATKPDLVNELKEALKQRTGP